METPFQPSDEDFEREFPSLLRNVYCGFSLPDGWRPLVWKLCHLIDWHMKNVNGRKKEDEEKLDPTVAQVKEKFGGLRFYCDNTDDVIDAFIMFAEHMSFGICAACGTNQNVTTKGRWRMSLCGKCRSES